MTRVDERAAGVLTEEEILELARDVEDLLKTDPVATSVSKIAQALLAAPTTDAGLGVLDSFDLDPLLPTPPEELQDGE